MKILLFCVAGCLAALLPGATSKSTTLPKEFKTCKRGDDVCIIEAVRVAIPILVRGLPKLGVVPIDPLRVDELVINKGSGPVQIKLTVKNQDVFGIGGATITSVRSETSDESFLLEIKGKIATAEIRGDYSVAGRVLLLPLTGHGANNFTFVDVDLTVLMEGHVISRQGEEFIELDNFHFSFDTSRVYIGLENLFNGDKVLGDNMVVFLNENWRILLEELRPPVQRSVGEIFRSIVRNIFSRVPYAILFSKEG